MLTPYQTMFGKIVHQDSLIYMRDEMPNESVDLIFTSPPFGLVRKKDYGNVDADKYVDWFKPFGAEFQRILKNTGSLVIDIGGAWVAGQPTRSLYHFDLLIMLCRQMGFHLAQEFYWFNPAKLPSPAEWVNIRRVRVKDSINCIWWLSKTPWPRANNQRVLAPYSDSMEELLKNGYTAKLRPSGHDISNNFSINNGASIPPNLLIFPNTESNSGYLRYCKEQGIKPHPARFPSQLPEFFIRMLTDTGDFVFDPFGGSCVTGEVCERLVRKWACSEIVEEYVLGAQGRFIGIDPGSAKRKDPKHYKISNPASLWNGVSSEKPSRLPRDGGSKRPEPRLKSHKPKGH